MPVSKAAGPQLLPITQDAFHPQDYAVVPGHVEEVNRHEPPALRAAWDKAAADGFVTRDEGRAVQHAVVRHSLFLDRSTQPNSVEAKFLAARLQDPQVHLDPTLRQALEAQLQARQTRMEQGEILSGSFKSGDRLHELTEGVIPMPLEDFLKRMPADRWGANLAEYRGGEIKVTARDAQGRVTQQRERMVTETPFSKYLKPLFGHLANDMTKVESIHYEPDRVCVKWEVLASDNKTTLADIGELRFIRQGAHTKVEFESEHRIDAFPGTLPTLERLPVINKVIQGATESILRDFFEECIGRYQDVGAGRVPSY